MMCKPAIKKTASQLVISLLIGLCTIVLPIGENALGGDLNGELNYDTATTERFVDFTNGIIEEIGGGIVTIDTTEYFLSQETRFTNMNEDIIDVHTIQAGDMVELTFVPMENNIILEIELQEKAVGLKNDTDESARKAIEKTDKIMFKNGVYSN